MNSDEWKKPFTDLCSYDKSLCVMLDSMLVIDDSGGVCITSVSDAEAVGYFLVWLGREREKVEAERVARVRQSTAIERRKTFTAVQGASESTTK